MIVFISGCISILFIIKIYKFIKQIKEYNKEYKKAIKEFSDSLK